MINNKRERHQPSIGTWKSLGMSKSSSVMLTTCATQTSKRTHSYFAISVLPIMRMRVCVCMRAQMVTQSPRGVS